MEKSFESPENPQEKLQNCLKDLSKSSKSIIDEESIGRMMTSVEKNKPSNANIEILALRALKNAEIRDLKESVIDETKQKINELTKSTGISINKRQYRDILTRAGQHHNTKHSTRDIYQTLEANILAKSYSDKFKENGVPVSLKFQDKIAMHIERGNISAVRMEQNLNQALETVKSNPTQWNDKYLKTEKGHTKGAVFEKDGKYTASIVAFNKEEQKNKWAGIFTIDTNKPDSNGKEYTPAEAEEYCKDSVEKAVNTNAISAAVYKAMNDKSKETSVVEPEKQENAVEKNNEPEIPFDM